MVEINKTAATRRRIEAEDSSGRRHAATEGPGLGSVCPHSAAVVDGQCTIGDSHRPELFLPAGLGDMLAKVCNCLRCRTSYSFRPALLADVRLAVPGPF